MRVIKVLIWVILVISFLTGMYAYTFMPASIVTHWGFSGQPNGFMGKFWGLFLIPIVSLVLVLIFFFIPKIDPLRKNIEKFRNYYDGLILVLVIFMLFIEVYLILWNVGIQANSNIIIPIICGILFLYIGLLLPHTKRNWFVGIRTPWTISSDNVWDKTHRFGGKLFSISGVISVFGAFFGRYAFLFVIVPVIIAAFVSVVYSYVIFRKINK